MKRKRSSPSGLILSLFIAVGAIWLRTFKGGLAESISTFTVTTIFSIVFVALCTVPFILPDSWGKSWRMKEDHTSWNFLISLVLTAHEIRDLREMLTTLHEQDAREYGAQRAEFLYRWRVLRSLGWYAVRSVQRIAGLEFIAKLFS